MAFITLILIVVFVVVLSRKNTEIEEAYRRGYNDGQAGRRIVESHQEMLTPQPTSPAAGDSISANVAQSTLSPEPIAEVKPPFDQQKTRLQNLNTILYMASFLLVAAAATLLASAVPPMGRLIGLIIIVGLFYLAGMVLHLKVPRLRPAAVAFVGTGLAILPFVGIALTILGGLTEVQAWLLTSLVGVAAYVLAALVLQSQVVSYLSLAFVLSLASSVVASVQLPLVWYFIVLIGLSLLANVVAFLWPRLLPGVFKRPVEKTGQIVTPLTLLASLFIINETTIETYEIIFGLATAHYLAVWLLQRRYVYEAIARGLAHASLLIVGWDLLIEHGSVAIGLYWLILLVAQALYSFLRVSNSSTGRYRETAWIRASLVLMVAGMVAWIGSDIADGLVCLSLISIIVVSLCATARLRNWYCLLVSGLAFVPLVLAGARLWFDPAWDWSIVIGIFSAVLFGLILWRQLTVAGGARQRYVIWNLMVVYTLTILAIGLSLGEMTAFWSSLIVAAGLLALSYIERRASLEVVAGILVAVAIGFGISVSTIDDQWQVLAAAILVAAVFTIGGLIHQRRHETMRRDGLIGLAAIAGASLAVNVFVDLETVRQTSLVLLLVGSVVAYGLRRMVPERAVDLSQILIASYFGYSILAVLVAASLTSGWLALAFAVTTLVIWLGSYCEKRPLLMTIGNLTLIAAVIFLWSTLDLSDKWAVHGQAWLIAVIVYGLYWLTAIQGDRQRERIQLVSSLSVLGFLVIITFYSYTVSLALATAATIVAVAAMVGIDGYRQKDMRYVEAAIYVATFGLQRVASLLIPEIHIVFYAHWWAITLLLTAWYLPVIRHIRLMVAMGFITAVVGLTALLEGGWYSLLFLIEHLGLLLFGALRNVRWALWWGVAASSLAVMYFLRDYVYLWLGFLGLALIGVVIWRLVSSDSKPAV